MSHPLDRMKPQRGRRLDLPAPVMVVPSTRGERSRWPLTVLPLALSLVVAVVSVIAVQAFL